MYGKCLEGVFEEALPVSFYFNIPSQNVIGKNCKNALSYPRYCYCIKKNSSCHCFNAWRYRSLSLCNSAHRDCKSRMLKCFEILIKPFTFIPEYATYISIYRNTHLYIFKNPVMKNGLPFLRIIGGICLLFLIDSESFGQCSQCLSNVLILNTGVNQETSNNAFYGTGSQDDFWTLIQGPSSEGPYPKCAYSRGASSNHINGALNPCCDVSASPSGICDGNMTGNANDCHWGGGHTVRV